MEFIEVTRKNDYAIVELNRGKVNALNHQMAREIRSAFEELKNDDSIRGAIITGKPHYFSAGLDLIELFHYDREQIKEFWMDFLGMMLDLARFEKPLIAAISGHSPAGGTVIALTCDYRFMVHGEKYLIGLNEVAVGINITDSIFRLYQFWVGKRHAYQALLQGRLMAPAEAHEVGLIDELVDPEELLPQAELKLQSILTANNHILMDAKRIMRKELLAEIDIDPTSAIDARVEYWMSEESRANIGQFVARLTRGK